MVPSFIIFMWLSGLLSLAILGGAIFFGYDWYQGAWAYDTNLQRNVFHPDLGWNTSTAILAAVVLMLIWTFFGGLILGSIAKLFQSANASKDSPKHTREGKAHRLARPDGTEIQIETYGPEDGKPIILTHGWGGTSTEWYYQKKHLTDKYRVIVWDLQGLGLSSRSANNDYSLKKMATDLDAVLKFAGDKPALLLGHSIGVMIILTYCQLFPAALGSRVAGLILIHGTYLNPLRTTKNAKLHTALERPLIIPLLYLTIALSPLVWIMNWLTYLSGMGHLSMKSGSFAETATWDQVDFITKFQPHVSPAVFARGSLGMLEFDASETLRSIRIPTLVVAADRDETCVKDASDYIHKAIPTSRLEILKPAKHMGLIEHHQDLTEAVRTFAVHCFGTGSTVGVGK